MEEYYGRYVRTREGPVTKYCYRRESVPGGAGQIKRLENGGWSYVDATNHFYKFDKLYRDVPYSYHLEFDLDEYCSDEELEQKEYRIIETDVMVPCFVGLYDDYDPSYYNGSDEDYF